MSQTPADDLLSMCAWCRRVKGADDTWHAARPGDATQTITHGICPTCEQRTLDAAERSRHGAAPIAPQAD